MASRGIGNVLSAGVPLPRLRLPRPCFPVGAEFPGDGDKSGHYGTGDDCVALPIGRLSVPATSWRPDMLRVAVSSRKPCLLETESSPVLLILIRDNLRDFSATALSIG